MVTDILKKITAAGLVGRGGASYPTAQKWTAVKAALKGRAQGYIVVNGAEGEPGVKKDGYILEHYPEEAVNGIYLAEQFLGAAKIKKIYFFLNREYYKESAERIRKVLAGKKYRALADKWEFIIKPETLTYISGEETALLNLIEKKKVQPRLKPPYPTEHGLYGSPTLINNTETFYNVSLAARGRYKNERFYTLAGAIKHHGVFRLPADLTISEVLRRTDNYPPYKFFIQAGGEASGEILNMSELEQPVKGAGSIMVYNDAKTDKRKLLEYWVNFYHEQSCGQCTACREGTYRLGELMRVSEFNHQTPDFDRQTFRALMANLADSSFCALGHSLPLVVNSYFKNILKN